MRKNRGGWLQTEWYVEIYFDPDIHNNFTNKSKLTG